MGGSRMTDPLEAGRVLFQALSKVAEQDESVRDALRDLHTSLGELLVELDARPTEEGGASSIDTAHPQAAGAAGADQPQEEEVEEPRVERTIRIGAAQASEPILVKQLPGVVVAAEGIHDVGARSGVGVPTSPSSGRDRGSGVDLGVIHKRANLKSEACRWALKNRRSEDAGPGEHDPVRAELQARRDALADCYVFALDPANPLPPDAALEQIASCFEVLARGAEVALRCEESYDEPEPPSEDLLELLAEAQSALRSALETADQHKDADQYGLYLWLKNKTWEHQIYLDRHMRVNDPADPAQWYDLRGRIDAFDEKRTTAEDRRRRKTDLLRKLRYHVERLAGAREDEQSMHWNSMAEVMEDWVEAGFPPSNRELCDLLLPLIDDIPDGLECGPKAQRVLKAVDELASSLQDRKPLPARERERTPEVLEAARLLRGKVVLMIGGQARRHAVNKLEEAFELGELRWMATTPHRSLEPLERAIKRPDVALVILAVRWSDHAMRDLKPIADGAGVPFLRLPGGYHPNRVATELLEQVSGQLGG